MAKPCAAPQRRSLRVTMGRSAGRSTTWWVKTCLDLERGEMQITAAMKDVQGHRWWGRPKTPHSRRTIPLTPLAIASLKRHKLRQAEERLARGADWNPDQLVFTTSTGTAYSQTNFRKQQYIPIIKKAGLPYVRPHGHPHRCGLLSSPRPIREGASQ